MSHVHGMSDANEDTMTLRDGRMRILGHIHTFNDEEVIQHSLQAMLDQSLPLDEILVVDNASTDQTLQSPLLEKATVTRHSENRGTSGAVITGCKYAIEKHYDWIWIIDADSAPRKDALEKLVALYNTFPPEVQEQVWLLSCLHIETNKGVPRYQMKFTPRGIKPVQPVPDEACCEFDSTIWSGSLYKLEAVQAVGLPSPDYVLDWGEHEYGYRGRRLGYRAFMHQGSLLDHNIGKASGLQVTSYKLGSLSLSMRELPPIRCYYLVRNLLYFWLYEYHARNISALLICSLRVGKLTASFFLRGATHGPEISACLRGIRDGILGKTSRRF